MTTSQTETTETPVRRLTCCCCGEVTLGRQWHNLDLGYGLCAECWDRIAKHRPFACEPMTYAEMTRCYGEPGYHHSIATTCPVGHLMERNGICVPCQTYQRIAKCECGKPVHGTYRLAEVQS